MNWRDTLRMHPLSFGTMAIGGQFPDVTGDDATATLQAAYAAGIRLFDTAPQYGCGLAEERLGAGLKGVPRDDVVIATKVGKVIAPAGSGGQNQRALFFPGGHDGEIVFDYSRDGTLRSIEQSLKRLGTDRLDIVLIHDLTRHFHGEDGVHARCAEALDGAVPALQRLREEGVIGAFGTGLKDVDIVARMIEEADIDVALVPGRLTLLEQSAATSGLIDLCSKHGVGYIAASPYDSGILATGPREGTTYGYRPADAEIRARAAAIDAVCQREGVPLAAAALNYARLFPSVVSVLSGMRTPTEVAANSALMATQIPARLWQALAAETGLALPEM